MNPFLPSPTIYTVSDIGRQWLMAYDQKQNGKPVTSFYARDVWAEVLKILSRNPENLETLWLQFKPSRLAHLIGRTELRQIVDLLLTNGYIEPADDLNLTTK